MASKDSTPNGQSAFVQAYWSIVDQYAEVTGTDPDQAERELEERRDLRVPSPEEFDAMTDDERYAFNKAWEAQTDAR